MSAINSVTGVFSDAASRGSTFGSNLFASFAARARGDTQNPPPHADAGGDTLPIDAEVTKAAAFFRTMRECATPELEALIMEIPKIRAELAAERALNSSLSCELSVSNEVRVALEKRALSAENDARSLIDRLRAWRGEHSTGPAVAARLQTPETSPAASSTQSSAVASSTQSSVVSCETSALSASAPSPEAKSRREAVAEALRKLDGRCDTREEAASQWNYIALLARAEAVAQQAIVTEAVDIRGLLSSEGVALYNAAIIAEAESGGKGAAEPSAVGAVNVIKGTNSLNAEAEGAVIEEGPKPSKGRGVRILSLDGGGIRGLACIRMLREIERQTGRPIYDLFDLIVGTSSGGVLALGLSARMSLDRLEQVFGEIRENFRDTSVWLAEVKRVVVGISHDTEVAEMNLRRAFTDDKRLRDLPRAPFTAVLATSSTREPLQPFLFRTYELQKSVGTPSLLEGTSDARVWEAARATSSAPTFFVPVNIGQKQYVDGAIIANNPSAVALAEASVLFPTLPIEVFVCIGTGRARDREWKAVGFAQWASKLFDLTMSSDLTHLLIGTILSSGEGQSQRYWRFDAEHEVVPAVSETSADLIDRLLANTDTYIHEKRQAFEAVGKALSS